MLFWGITCESGKRYSQIPAQPFHVSMAALEPKDKIPDNKYVSLMLEHNGKEFLLCTLDYENVLQVNLDLMFGQGEETFFFINGEGTIHLSGYVIADSNTETYEGLANLNAACSTSNALLDNQADDDSIDQLPGTEETMKKLLAFNQDSDDDDDDDFDEDWNPELAVRQRSSRRLGQQSNYDDLVSLDTDEESYDEEEEDSDDEDEEDSDEDAVEEDEEESEDNESEPQLVEEAEIAGPSTSTGKRKKFLTPEPVGKRLKKESSGTEKLEIASGSEKTIPASNGPSAFIVDAKVGDPLDDMNSSIGRTPMPKKKKTLSDVKLEDTGSPAFKPNKSKKKSQQTEVVEINDDKQVYNTKLPNGVEIHDVRVGNGPVAKKGKFVHVFYIGRLENGKEFDSTKPGKDKPLSFRLGRNEVIPGWDHGIQGMHVGGRRKLRIPPHMGYGKKANGPIPANSTLLFTVDLKAVN